MHAYQGNLCVPDDPAPSAFASPNFFSFDIAAVGLGFHHFDDPTLAAQRLVERLRPGGVLLILDFFSHAKPEVRFALSLHFILGQGTGDTNGSTYLVNTCCVTHHHAPRFLRGANQKDL